MQYLQTSMVLLLGRQVIAMHLSLFCVVEGLAVVEEEVDAEAESTEPPQMGLGFSGK